MCMCSLVFQDGTCNIIPHALYKCQEVFGKLENFAVNLPTLNFSSKMPAF